MRRANGTGSIVDLGKNRRKRYAVKVSYLARPGLWKQRYLAYCRTAREAQETLEDYLRSNAKPQDIGTTLGDVYAVWSARKYAKAGSASVASYKASWARLSALEGKEIRKVTIDDLQAIIDQDEAKGLSKSSISNDKSLMKALYKHAMERDMVQKDLSEFVELPSVGAKWEKGAFDDTTMHRLEKMAKEGFPWADTALILCYTGFRVSEFLGLTRFSYHDEGYLQGGMKTEAGRGRIVPVHPKIDPYLQRWLSKGGNYIICDDAGEQVPYKEYFRHFSEVAKALGYPQATPHWCRHTAASRMKMAGVEDLAIKRILGHSDKNVTEHYTHVDLEYLSKELLKVS